MRRLRPLLCLLLAAGCASAPPKKIDLTPLTEADAKVLQGCYDCLIEARGIYERFAAGSTRSLVIVRLFETQLLLALREKELALDSAASIDRARELAKELPPAAEAERFLALVDFASPDGVGTPRRQKAALAEAHKAFVPRINDELAWLKSTTALSAPVRQYLSLAVDCAALARPGRAGALFGSDDFWIGSSRARDAPAGTTPLVAYRISICDGIGAKSLEAVRTAVPRFVEAAFFLGRLEVANAGQTGGGPARTLLSDAYRRFPTSPSVTYLSGNLSQMVGDCREALQFYDETLALQPVHEDALLGRTMCLAYLRRFDEAVSQATRMIELQTDNWGEAFYWRAWIRHAQGDLPAARADVERAKQLVVADKSFTLAGMIEHDQDDLDVAERDLTLARRLNPKQCVAMWYLGMVGMKRQQWSGAGRDFEAAMSCYQEDVTEDTRLIQSWEAREMEDVAFKARQVANFRAALAEDQKQMCAAALNATMFYARGDNAERARQLIEIAAGDPALAEKVAQLRQILREK